MISNLINGNINKLILFGMYGIFVIILLMDREEDEVNPAFVCPISNQIFEDPVIADDGQTYERQYIEDWLRRNPISPKTREPMKIENLRPNNVIKKMIVQFLRFEAEFRDLKRTNAEFSKTFEQQIKKVENQKDIQSMRDKLATDISVQAFMCPLTKKLFVDPVLCEDGLTYQRKAIQTWLQKNTTSPLLGTEIGKKIIPNYAIKGIIDALQEEKQKQWVKIKEKQKTFFSLFGPKIRKFYYEQKIEIEYKAALQIVQSWGIKKEDRLNYSCQKWDKQTNLNYSFHLCQFSVALSAKIILGMSQDSIYLAQKQKKKVSSIKIKEQNSNDIKINQMKISAPAYKDIKINEHDSEQSLFQQIEHLQKKMVQLDNFLCENKNSINFQVPQLCSDYVERKELQNKISSNFKNSKVVCLYGFRGSGKTQLSIFFANQAKFGQTIWLNCLSTTYLVQQIKTYLQNFHKCDKLKEKTQEHILFQFQTTLCENTLIILDDAVQKVIQQLKLTQGKARILINSQQSYWKCPIIQIKPFLKILIQQNSQESQLCSDVSFFYSKAFIYAPNQKNNKKSNKIQKRSQQEIKYLEALCSSNKLKQFYQQLNSSCQGQFSSLVFSLDIIRKQHPLIDQILVFLGYIGGSKFNDIFALQYFRLLEPQKKLPATKENQIKEILNCLTQNSILRTYYQNNQTIYQISYSTCSSIKRIHKIDGTLFLNYNKMDKVKFYLSYNGLGEIYAKFFKNNPDYRQVQQKKKLEENMEYLRMLYHSLNAHNQNQNNFEKEFLNTLQSLQFFQNIYEAKRYLKLCLFASSVIGQLIEQHFPSAHHWRAYAHVNKAASLIIIKDISSACQHLGASKQIMQRIKLPQHHPTYKTWIHLITYLKNNFEISTSNIKQKIDYHNLRYSQGILLKNYQLHQKYIEGMKKVMQESKKIEQGAYLIQNFGGQISAVIKILEQYIAKVKKIFINQIYMVKAYFTLASLYEKIGESKKAKKMLIKFLFPEIKKEQYDGIRMDVLGLVEYYLRKKSASINMYLLHHNDFKLPPETNLLQKLIALQNIAAQQILKCWSRKQKIKINLSNFRKMVIKQHMSMGLPNYLLKDLGSLDEIEQLDEDSKILLSSRIFLIQKQIYMAKAIELDFANLKHGDGSIFQLPDLCEGHSEKSQLIQRIQNLHKMEKIVCIEGLPCTGKSQLAVSYVRKQKFKKIVWLNCFTFQLMMFQIRFYLQTFHSLEKSTQKKSKQILLQFIKALDECSILILDDAEQQTVKHLTLHNTKSKILITSRRFCWSSQKLTLRQPYLLQIEKNKAVLSEYIDDSSWQLRQNPKEILKKILGTNKDGCYFLTCQISTKGFFAIAQDKLQRNSFYSIVLEIHRLKCQNPIIDQILAVIGYVSGSFSIWFIILYFLQILKKQLSKHLINLIQKQLLLLFQRGLITKKREDDEDDEGIEQYQISSFVLKAITQIHKAQGKYEENYYNVCCVTIFIKFNEMGFDLRQLKYFNDEQQKYIHQKQQLLHFIPFFQHQLCKTEEGLKKFTNTLDERRKIYEAKKYYWLLLFTNKLYTCLAVTQIGNKQKIAYEKVQMASVLIRLGFFSEANQLIESCQEIMAEINLSHSHQTYKMCKHFRKIINNYFTFNAKYPKEIDINDWRKYDEFDKKLHEEMQMIEEGAVKAKQLMDQNKDIKKAIELLYRKVFTLTKYQSKEDIRLSRTLYCLGCAYTQANNNQKARDFFQRVVAVHQKVELQENIQSYSYWIMLAECYQKIGKSSEADRAYNIAKQILEKSQPEEEANQSLPQKEAKQRQIKEQQQQYQ